MVDKNNKVVCICRGGQVRSVATRQILADQFGFRKVLTCGWEKNDADTVNMLCEWADTILVVGSNWQHVPTEQYKYKTHHLNVGCDRWGNAFHPDLHQLLLPMIVEFIMS